MNILLTGNIFFTFAQMITRIMKRTIGNMLVGVVIVLFACGSQEGKGGVDWAERYRDSVFIDLGNGDLEVQFLEGMVDGSLYFRAAARVLKTPRIQGDTLYLPIKNGAEVKVSENVYRYLVDVMRRQNGLLRTDTSYEIRMSLRDSTYFVTRKSARFDWAKPCR